MKAFLAFLAVAMLSVSGCVQTGGVDYEVAGGAVSYSDRPEPSYHLQLFNRTESAAVYNITFMSRGKDIYGFLSIPYSCTESAPCPAFVLLHAQGLRKKAEQRGLGNMLNGMGFITLAIDQRGHGQTGGQISGMEAELDAFIGGEETVQSMMVYDCLASYDILVSLRQSEPGMVFVSGQSMGGRYAAIAAAIEPGIRGAMLISTAGYGLPSSGFSNIDEFYKYVDPDSYIADISPRKLLMVHGAKDWIIPLEQAERSFGLANEPKKMIVVDERFHGFYNIPKNSSLPGSLREGVEWLLL